MHGLDGVIDPKGWSGWFALSYKNFTFLLFFFFMKI